MMQPKHALLKLSIQSQTSSQEILKPKEKLIKWPVLPHHTLALFRASNNPHTASSSLQTSSNLPLQPSIDPYSLHQPPLSLQRPSSRSYISRHQPLTAPPCPFTSSIAPLKLPWPCSLQQPPLQHALAPYSLQCNAYSCPLKPSLAPIHCILQYTASTSPYDYDIGIASHKCIKPLLAPI